MNDASGIALSTERAPLSPVAALQERLRTRTATICVIGLGYVGLPLANLIASKGFRVLGFDIDRQRVEMLRDGTSYIKHVSIEPFRAAQAAGRAAVTAEVAALGEADALLISVPTPLGHDRQPDLGAVEAAAAMIADRLRPGTLVVLESTTFPGTCRDVVRPILERSGLRCGEDFFLAYSPEREDPGNLEYETATIPRVVAGADPVALELACDLYSQLVAGVVPVGTIEVAEAIKITENVFRAVNVALVNELKATYEALGIDIWQVIAGASTKPFGYMPFFPGPGIGGHCLPIDPFLLNWKAREHGGESRLIELAGEINGDMPRRVVDRLARALLRSHGLGLRRSRVLLLGLAYKRNIDDIREGPGLRLLELLEDLGAEVDYHDPFVPSIPEAPEYGGAGGRTGVPWSADLGSKYDAALIVTDHDQIDYAGLVAACPLVVDTRNACESHGVFAANVVKA